MAQMTDPSDALESFQLALRRGEIQPRRCETDSDLYVLLDHPDGEARITYVRLNHRKVTAQATFIMADPINGTPCFGIGYAVPERYRGQGRAKDVVEAGIREMKHGLSRANLKTFYVEAIVGSDNIASQHVAAATISTKPVPVTDNVSGLPALQYVRSVGEDPTN